MSFASEVKSELAGLDPAQPAAGLQELRGLALGVRARVGGEGSSLRLPALRNQIARKVVRLGRQLGVEPRIVPMRGAHELTFSVELPHVPRLGRWLRPDPPRLPTAATERKALLRGFFLGCGSVNGPTARYHLELVPPTLAWATALVELLGEHGIRAGVTDRARQPLVYVKDGDGVAAVLSLCGASRAVMAFESARVVREVSAQINRQLNFETANLDKTADSSSRQLAAIRRLRQSGRLSELSPALREMAELRLGYPELSLQELAGQLGLSKSGSNHRLRRLMRMAEGTGEKETSL
ncbi:MAG: DNA-binding protein WhiA [Candidatus Dormiibacterota bacterium]